MIGPFAHPPFPNFHINPLGIATRKYSGKKYIIICLSAPHGSTIHSIIGLIPSKDFSLHYATTNCGSQNRTSLVLSMFSLSNLTSGDSKLFNILSEAFSQILLNNHKIPFLVCLLDDFLIISLSSSPPASGSVTPT